MNYKIFDDSDLVNIIVADEEFVTAYCSEMGYTFEEVPEPPAPPPEPPAPEEEPVSWAVLAKAIQEGVDQA